MKHSALFRYRMDTLHEAGSVLSLTITSDQFLIF